MIDFVIMHGIIKLIIEEISDLNLLIEIEKLESQ
jgi:hypothetical protein